MALTIGNSVAVTNGTTVVEVVSAPGTGEQRIIRNITVFNNDTAAKTFELLLVNSTGPVTSVIASSGSIASRASWSYSETLILDSTTEAIKIQLTAAKTTNDCDVTAHFVTEG